VQGKLGADYTSGQHHSPDPDAGGVPGAYCAWRMRELNPYYVVQLLLAEAARLALLPHLWAKKTPFRRDLAALESKLRSVNEFDRGWCRGTTANEEKQAAAKSYGLDPMFAPASVAVLARPVVPAPWGAVLENLLHGGFRGKVYAVNAKHPEVLGLKAYASIRDVPGPVDLAVATPAATVPQLIGECVDAGANRRL
jgi:hypothetical protein